MGDEDPPGIVEYIPPERYSHREDLTHLSNPVATLGYIDRVLFDWRQRKHAERWKAQTERLEAMRAAYIARQMTDDAIIEYIKSAERLYHIDLIKATAREQAERDIEEERKQREHERNIAEYKRQTEAAEAESKAIRAAQEREQARRRNSQTVNEKGAPKSSDPLSDFRAKLAQRQKIEAERDRMIEEILARALASGKAVDDPGVQRDINNLMDHAQQLIEKTYE
jgi:hypothetical protein